MRIVCACMHVCVCVHACVRVFVCVHACVRVFVCVHACVRVFVCVHVGEALCISSMSFNGFMLCKKSDTLSSYP